MGVEQALRSRWLPGVLAIGLATLALFYSYKVYGRTKPISGTPSSAAVGSAAAWPGRKPGDFRHFYYAGEAINKGQNIYEAGEKGYIYPPLFALVMAPLAHLEPTTAERVWALANALLIAAILGIAFRDAVRRFGVPADRITLLGSAFLALLLTLDQVRWELEMGQSDTLVLLGFTLGLYWLDRRPLLAGIALGFAANIKYQSLIAVPYLLVRRRFKAAGAALVSTVGWALLPTLVTGWDTNLRYLGTALGRLGWVAGVSEAGTDAHMHPATWINSISLTSFAARWAEQAGSGPAFIIAVVSVIAVAMFAACWTIYRRQGVPLIVGRSPAKDPSPPWNGVVALEWYGLIVAVLAFGPQSMVRHTFLLLAMHVLVAALLLAPRVGVRRWPLIAGVVIFQLGTKLPPGEDMFERSLEVWRYFGGSSWCMLVMYATLLWVGLEYARAAADGRPLLYLPDEQPSVPPVADLGAARRGGA